MASVFRRLRRSFLLVASFVVVLAAISGAAQAQTFDRVEAKARYYDWYQRFLTDYAAFEKACQAGPVDAARVNEVFAHSVAPDSRMTQMLADFAARPGMMRGSSGDPGAVSMAFIMVRTLEQALPAGFGGAYHNEKPIAGDADSFVWYMHIHSGDDLQKYFEDPKAFNPYHLPAYGVLERNAYPFVNFRDKDGKLLLSGLSAEFVNVLNAIWQLQLQ